MLVSELYPCALPVGSQAHEPGLEIDLDASVLRKEARRMDEGLEEIVVVHAYELLRQVWDAKEPLLHNIAIECRLIFGRNERVLINVLESGRRRSNQSRRVLGCSDVSHLGFNVSSHEGI